MFLKIKNLNMLIMELCTIVFEYVSCFILITYKYIMYNNNINYACFS